MSVYVTESGVRFGPFDPDHIFQIERSPSIAALGEGVKKVEFILKRANTGNNAIFFIEAKSSIPREADAFFSDIKMKMLHSLTLWLLALVKRHATLHSELPLALHRTVDAAKPYMLILVIPLMPNHALVGATDKFRQIMGADLRVWHIGAQNVRVLNEEKARSCGLIT